MEPKFEWDVEIVDKAGETKDHYFSERLSEIGFDPKEIDGKRRRLVVIRGVRSKVDEQSRAYVMQKDGKWTLPVATDDGYKVPLRMHKELEQWLSKIHTDGLERRL